ncbi:MAG: hypothetical protein CMF62_03440 [Magnetococcales bacterium]|nr:hypothetical protein [Magnetococcales bacterium]
MNKNIDENELNNDLELTNDIDLIQKEKDVNFENYEKPKEKSELNLLKELANRKSFNKFYNSKCAIQRNGDAVSGTYLRIEIPHDIKPEEILQKYANVEIQYIIGGGIINKSPLKIFYYLCEKFGRDIEIVNPKKIFNKSSKYVNYKKKHIEVSQRLYFENSNMRYLDIPIIFEDFNYSHVQYLITNQFHEIEYILKGDNLKESCYIVNDKVIYYLNYDRRKRMNMDTIEKLTNTFKYKIIDPSENLNFNIANYAKFIFLIMEKNQESYIDFPEIESLTVMIGNKTIHYNTYNFLLEDYENCRIYGISLDSNLSMKKWMDFKKEQNENDLSVINSTNNKLLYKVLDNIKNINIKLSRYIGNIKISILSIHQNILRNMCGMSGNVLNHN